MVSPPCPQKQLLRSRQSPRPAGRPHELLIQRRRRAKEGSQNLFFLFEEADFKFDSKGAFGVTRLRTILLIHFLLPLYSK